MQPTNADRGSESKGIAWGENINGMLRQDMGRKAKGPAKEMEMMKKARGNKKPRKGKKKQKGKESREGKRNGEGAEAKGK